MIQVNGTLNKAEAKILQILSDGELHLRDELLACYEDELMEFSALNVYLSNLRKKLPAGLLIVQQNHPQTKRFCYRMVRKLANPYKE